MKKLLLVLLVVALASFLLTGCFGVPEDGTDGDGGGVAAICPTITITGQYAGVDKTYVKASATAEVVVTYTVPTEGVSIYLVGTETTKVLLPYTVSADGLVYTASADLTCLYKCDLIMIEVVDCYGECTCVESFVVDCWEPKAKMMLSTSACVCEGCAISIKSDYVIPGLCADDLGCCADDCSGVASWSIKVYNKDPYDVCCTTECAEPVVTCGAAACPIECISECLLGNDESAGAVEAYYMVMSMLDNVGNENKYWAMVEFDSGCEMEAFTWWDAPNKAADGSSTDTCLDWTSDGTPETPVYDSAFGWYVIFGESCTWDTECYCKKAE